jgi:hypothetical protein
MLLRWSDLTGESQKLAREMGLQPAAIEQFERRAAERLREGEVDHLIFYMLQSRSFTSEPAGYSAKRVADLRRALEHPADERQRYFASIARGIDLEREYQRVAAWLRAKETECDSQACIAKLYESRGHSSDTAPESNIAVRKALEFTGLRKRVLIVGPGLDWAPRVNLRDEEPRMYQPQAIREMLPGARIECADLNPRVVAYARKVCDDAFLLNAVTQHSDQKYDLIVATNVLAYMSAEELLLAMNNVAAMLGPGGCFVHNDARFETKLFGRAAGIPAKRFGTVTLDEKRRPPTLDHYIVHCS